MKYFLFFIGITERVQKITENLSSSLISIIKNTIFYIKYDIIIANFIIYEYNANIKDLYA
jgi:hypothetical protein